MGKYRLDSSTDSLSVTDLNEKSGEYNILYFLPNGEPYWIFEGWTKGIILIHYGGDEPILTYRYDLRDIGDRQYLFFRLDDKTEVFVKADSERYTKETLGIHDNIDLTSQLRRSQFCFELDQLIFSLAMHLCPYLLYH